MQQVNQPVGNGLEVTLERKAASIILHLKGRVDIDSSPDLRDRLFALFQTQSSQAITVDLAEVPYIDASGLATFIEALKVSRRNRIEFCLLGLTGSVLHLFEVTGVLAVFETSGCPTSISAPKVS